MALTDPINFAQALAEPERLQVAPPEIPGRPVDVEIREREIPGQLFSATKAWELRDRLVSGERDLNNPVNDNNFALPPSLEVKPTSDQVDMEVEESNEDRDEIGVDRIEESLFRQFRDPGLSRDLIVRFLDAMGLENEFHEDLRTL
ncbi:hypothetical protein LCGC14_0430400 [marine sediment metagenome]|uniref:Uncharacterized protein n=1 Tax=marine sediment metagenome TaxID=412755 RepID=A0A0F9T6C3_9ZZZZ